MAADPNTQSLHQPLIPGLPDSLVLCFILPKLPFPRAAALRVVNSAWNRSLHPSNLISLRASLGVSQPFLLLTSPSFYSMFSEHANFARLALFDPLSGAHLPIPDPACMLFGCFVRTIVETDGSNILVIQLQQTTGHTACTLCCFNLGTNRWYHWNIVCDPSLCDGDVAVYLHTTRTVWDGYLYLAGWRSHVVRVNYGEALRKALNGEDEFSIKMQWESLPRLIKQRYYGAVVAWKGKICMFGGAETTISRGAQVNSSGEIWDPSMRGGGWTLLPDFWPSQFHKSHRLTPSVGIIDGRLCAIFMDDPLGIMYYEDHTKTWIPWIHTGNLIRTCSHSLPRFFATGPTLWVLYEQLFEPRERAKITISALELHNDALGMKALKLPCFMKEMFFLSKTDKMEPSPQSQAISGPRDLTFDFPMYELSFHATSTMSDTFTLGSWISCAISI